MLKKGETKKECIYRILKDEVLTEENTDDLIKIVMDKIKFPRWIPKFIIIKFLDKQLPEKLLKVFEAILIERSVWSDNMGI